MKKISAPLRNLAFLGLMLISFIACEREFNTIDSDIINQDAAHFDTRENAFDVITYTKVLEPVQGNSYPINLLGVFTDPIYGKTTASVVTQLTGSVNDPDFGFDPQLESVVLTIPYFSSVISVDGDVTNYELDSVFGNTPIDIELYENKFFLRDLDPNGEDINDAQVYYVNGSLGSSSIPQNLLEGTALDTLENFLPSNQQVVFTNTAGDTIRIAPALREELDVEFWQEKILDNPDNPAFSSSNNFRDFLRGLYFKVSGEETGNNLTLMNFTAQNANITLNYTAQASETETERTQRSYVINFSGNRVNLISSSEFDYPDVDEESGDEKLYLKGNQGSRAVIELFGGENIDDDDSTLNQFEAFKNEFVETDENGKFLRAKRLINEASLVFFVDQSSITDPSNQPERLFLYNADTNQPLVDYFLDIDPSSENSSLGVLEREGDDPNAIGVKYKFKVTEHIKSILLRDSTNVELGLSVSSNVSLEGLSAQYDVLSEDDNEKVPLSSLITQKSTVLFGNNASDPNKSVFLEIIYTEPEL